jgi:MFS family permease
MQRTKLAYDPDMQNKNQYLVVSNDSRQSLPEHEHANQGQKTNAFALYERCVFISSVFSIGVFSAWITWAPFLHLLVPELKQEDADPITTISQTFKDYNAGVTILLIMPLTAFFFFRTYRVFTSTQTKARTKKKLFLLLVTVQYFIFIVLRYDYIQDTLHFIFTFFTICLLYVYHVVLMSEPHNWTLMKTNLKQIFLGLSVFFVFVFAYTQGFADVQNDTTMSGLSCISEVLGILFLGVMDFVDIFTLAAKLDEAECTKIASTQNKDGDDQTLFFLQAPKQTDSLFLYNVLPSDESSREQDRLWFTVYK